MIECFVTCIAVLDTVEQDKLLDSMNPISNSTSVVDSINDLEAASSNKPQPVRKISRFLVSPAILTVTNEKNVQNTCIEETDKSQTEQTDLRKNQHQFQSVDINQTAIDFVRQVVDANLGPNITNASEILNQRYIIIF